MRDDAPYTDTDAPPGDNVTPLRPPALHNPDAERALLGALLLEPGRAPQLHDHLEPHDFDDPRYEQIWDAIYTVLLRDGVQPDYLMVTNHLRETGQLTKLGRLLPELIDACPTPANAEHYAAQVRNAARLRQADQALNRGLQLVRTATPDTVDSSMAETLQTLDDLSARVGPRHNATIRVPTIDDILAGDDEDAYDWVIPGLIEHQERVILTAEEGAGKSTLLRQIGITAAAGIHPFTGEAIDPVRVLHVDVENSLRQSRRRYRPLRIQAGANLDPDLLRVEIRMAGIDLTSAEDREWLLRTTAAVQPDLLLIGPIYKLANGDPTEETSAKPVAMILDQVREATDCGLILEAHVAKAPSGQKKRPHEPYGWSGWLRWPEIGIYLDKDGKLTHWRGAREERDWPHKIERGGHWPWTAALTGPDQLWIAIQKARMDHGKPMSQRDLVEATGIPKTTIARLVGPGGKYAHGWPGYNNSNKVTDKR
ncbi:AAA family ATPase [Aeromicrobium sp. 9AM]|uniref:AAA family ATPase n=1 Tax=Aeromicrobium sp. 9AM TaxID=2653126 RepID=UPI0012F0303F|nr:AAA family ATPase [Aeromicrobium sp. 9AM]VXB82555.1 putative Replicative DNA helicase [Aeromicrobium sp. 9AM]